MRSFTKLRVCAAMLIAPMFACAPPALAVSPPDFAISPVGAFPNYHWNVSVEGATATPNPTLTLIRGHTYIFAVSGITLSPHSFYINTVNTTFTTDQYTDGVTGLNNTADSTFTFTVPQTAPDTLFYNCGTHSSMAGMMSIDGIFADGFEAP